MSTECKQEQFEFQGINGRKIRADFNGGQVTSDAGGLLLDEVEKRMEILGQFSSCFKDHRNPDQVEHKSIELIRQRICGLAFGYEDLNDHDVLRDDPLLAILAGKSDPTGNDRIREKDKGHPLAGKSTLNRFELSPENEDSISRYKKVVLNEPLVEKFFVEVF